MSLRGTLSSYWYALQQEPSPRLEIGFGPLGGRYRILVAVIKLVSLETLLPSMSSLSGRPPQGRAALARAFIAKAVFDIPTTRALIGLLQVDRTLHRLRGFSSACRLPSEATCSVAGILAVPPDILRKPTPPDFLQNSRVSTRPQTSTAIASRSCIS